MRRTILPIFLFFLLTIGMTISAQTATAENDGPSPASPPLTEAEEEDKAALDFSLSLGIGIQSFDSPDNSTISYQSLQLLPDFSYGKFGMGLDLSLNYRFTGGVDGRSFEIRREDWTPEAANLSLLEVYLPKLRYIRWAEKDEPLYIKLGRIENARIGNGFIVNSYTNKLFLPERPIAGLIFDLDGRAFDFPFIGIESFIANLSVFNFFGGRFYIRPFGFLDAPLIQELEFGMSFFMDRDPYYHALIEDPALTPPPTTENVIIGGADVNVPIFTENAFALEIFGDIVLQKLGMGGMTGLGGKIVDTILYRAELRILGDNFTPVYFDRLYDLYRVQRYMLYSGSVSKAPYWGWLGSLGFSFLEESIVFNTEIEGPFYLSSSENFKVRSSLDMGPVLIPGVSLHLFYQKENIDRIEDLISPEEALMGGRISYHSGPAVLSFFYTLQYDPFAGPGENPWEVGSGLESRITLF